MNKLNRTFLWSNNTVAKIAVEYHVSWSTYHSNSIGRSQLISWSLNHDFGSLAAWLTSTSPHLTVMQTHIIKLPGRWVCTSSRQSWLLFPYAFTEKIFSFIVFGSGWNCSQHSIYSSRNKLRECGVQCFRIFIVSFLLICFSVENKELAIIDRCRRGVERHEGACLASSQLQKIFMKLLQTQSDRQDKDCGWPC